MNAMSNSFWKVIAKSEAGNHFIHSAMFTDQTKKAVKIHIGEKVIETYVDKRGRIWLPKRKIGKMLVLQKGSRVRLQYNKDGSYTLSIS